MAKWVSDSSPELSISADGQEVTCHVPTPSGSNVYNAIYKSESGGLSSGTHYWELTFPSLSDSVFVGITDEAKFQQGWAFSGLMYGGPGNLSSGSALVTCSYGPKITAGDTVGIYLNVTDENLKLYFSLNSTPLGLAFDLPRNCLGPIFPCLHFSGDGVGKIQKIDKTFSEVELERQEASFSGIEGNWKIFEFNGGSPASSATLGVEKREEGEYDVHMKVVNGINFDMSFKSGKWATPEGRISTRMGSSPELMKFEGEMNVLTTNPSKVEVGADGILTIENSASSMTSKWKRYSTAKSPVTTSPFY